MEDAQTNAADSIDEQAAKFGMTADELKERIRLVNNTANTFGQLLLNITDGDWNVALSIAGTFFASTLAQNAFNSKRDYKEVLDFVVPGIGDTAKIIYNALIEEEADANPEQDLQRFKDAAQDYVMTGKPLPDDYPQDDTGAKNVE